MSTAAKLESSISGGISGIKAHMNSMREQINAENEKTAQTEAEVDKAKRNYLKAYGRQQTMRAKMAEIEERLVKTEEKIKEMTRRVNEKELFLNESHKFNRSLKSVAPDANSVKETEERLKKYKEIYAQNYERCQKARNIKIELEQKFEFVETRAHESQKKLEALRTELEYNVLEEGRRQDGCKNAIDSAFKSEKTCLDVQKSYEVALKKKEVALKKVNSLEAKITKAENSMDSTNYDRRRIEATIKELLGNIKNQGM